MYEFGRFGTLWWYNGMKVRAGGHLITKNHLAWWWPINWIALLVAAPILIAKWLLKKIIN